MSVTFSDIGVCTSKTVMLIADSLRYPTWFISMAMWLRQIDGHWLGVRSSCKVLLWDGLWSTRGKFMSTSLEIHSVESLGQFTDFVESQTGRRWYRGVGDSEGHKLQPSLYRHPKLKESSDLLELEGRILQYFKQRCLPYLERPLREGDWDALFIMQHYGVPTRLLDWTENPYIGLYFALTSAQYERTDNGPLYQRDAAVWVLNSVEWNKKALEGGYGNPPEALTSEDGLVKSSYRLGDSTPWSARSDPVAIYGAYNSARIVAQRGTFTMFGTNTAPIEQTYVEKNYPQNCLLKLNIPKEAIRPLLEKLVSIGVADSVVYPDLGGLALEIKREYRYWV